jgi:transposase
MSAKVRKEYTPEQKAEAIRMALSSEQSVSEVARTLGMAESTLNRWVHQHKVDSHPSDTGALTTSERQELHRLRREVKQLQMERDFITAGASSRQSRPTHCLKKAAAFFAKDLC